MKLPTITKKQSEILELLYDYRYLNRIQIQALMTHKDKKTINMWLRDLTEKQYLKRIYSDHFLEKTKPAIYYMGINGIRYLKALTKGSKNGNNGDGAAANEPAYPVEELRKRYREHERSQSFIDLSILIAQCCIDCQNKATASIDNNGTRRIAYDTYTEAEYRQETNGYYFLSEHEAIQPNLCIIKNPDGKRTNYLLEIIDPNLPRYRLKNRLKNYVSYLDDDDWDSGDNDPLPIILIVLPTLTELIYAKRCTNSLFIKAGYESDDEAMEDMHIRFITTEQLQTTGITAKIWEERRKLYDV